MIHYIFYRVELKATQIMYNVSIVSVYRDQVWEGSEAVSFLKKHNCKVSLNYFKQAPMEDELIGILNQADGLITSSFPYSERVLSTVSRLKVIARTGVGFDAIDVDAATENGICVTITPGANSDSVADHVIGLMLSLARYIPRGDRDIRSGHWLPQVGIEVSRKTLGIIGLGSIGKCVARRGTGFEMKLLAYDLYQDTIFAAEHDIVYLPLDGLLAKSDFVSVHLPLLPETVGLLGERELKLMKPTAYLINTARGGIVDEDSLIKVLRGGRIAGAGLDVFSVEPLDQSPLSSMDQVVLSPHVAGVTEESWARMAFQSAENIIQVFQEQKPFGLVNQQVFQDKR